MCRISSLVDTTAASINALTALQAPAVWERGRDPAENVWNNDCHTQIIFLAKISECESTGYRPRPRIKNLLLIVITFMHEV
jgi:hypothetical protein